MLLLLQLQLFSCYYCSYLFFPSSQTRCKGQSTEACSHEQLYTGTCTREGEEKEGEEEKRGRGGMVDVKNRKCSCGKCVRFGMLGGSATHCKECKEQGMVDIRSNHLLYKPLLLVYGFCNVAF